MLRALRLIDTRRRLFCAGRSAAIFAALIALVLPGSALAEVTAAEIQAAIAAYRQSVDRFDSEIKAILQLDQPREQHLALELAMTTWGYPGFSLRAKAQDLVDAAKREGRIRSERLRELEADLTSLERLHREIERTTAQPDPSTYEDYPSIRNSVDALQRELDLKCRHLEWVNEKREKNVLNEQGQLEKRVIVQEWKTWDAELRRKLRELGVLDDDAPFGAGHQSSKYGLGAAQRDGLGWEAYTQSGGRYGQYDDALHRFGRIIKSKTGIPELDDVRYLIYLHRVHEYFLDDAAFANRMRFLLVEVVAFRWKLQLRIDRENGELENATGEERRLRQARIDRLKQLEIAVARLDYANHNQPEAAEGGLCWALKARWPMQLTVPEKNSDDVYVTPRNPTHSPEQYLSRKRSETYLAALLGLQAAERALR